MDFIPMFAGPWNNYHRVVLHIAAANPREFAVHDQEEGLERPFIHGDYFHLTPAGLKAALECFNERSGIKEQPGMQTSNDGRSIWDVEG
jgi:hypothetical protein